MEAALVYAMFLDNGGPNGMWQLGGMNRKEHVLMISVPGQNGFRVCIQEQNNVIGYDFRGYYRFGMNMSVSLWTCGGMISSQYVDQQVG